MKLLVALLVYMGVAAAATAQELVPASMPKDWPNCLQTHIVPKKKADQTSFSDTDYRVSLKLEIASTPEKRATGLMNRKTIGPCDGMAFWFPSNGPTPAAEFTPQKFWMKDTMIPLDMIFVNKAGKIIYIATAKPLSETLIGPEEPVATVIEIAGGRAAKEGIKVGDGVHYEIAGWTHRLAR